MTGGEVEGCVLNGDVAAQPKDMSIPRLDLGLVLPVRCNMPVRDGVGLVGIGLMNVLRRDSGRGHDPGRESDDEREMPD